MKSETWIYKVLKFFGLAKTCEINKKEMCEKAKHMCNRQCDNCAWHE